MTEDLREDRKEQLSGIPGAGELASAQDVLLAMVRTAKGLRIYQPNNPVLLKFVEELHERIVGHVARYGDLKLEVERCALRYRGAEVYLNEDPNESIAFRIFSDGIRVLIFTRGLERRELPLFLEIVGYDRPGQRDDDIVTRLWESNLPHLKYLLEEDFDEADWDEEQPEPLSQQEAISRLCSFASKNPPPPPRMLPKHLLMLTGEEAAWLAEACKAEANRNPLDDVIDILFSVLAGSKEPGTFDDFLEISADLTGDLFLSGDIRHALRLLRFLDRLMRLGSVTLRQRQQIEAVLAGMLSERVVQVLQETLDSDRVSFEELRELLQLLGLPSLGGICELLGRVAKLKVRKVIIEVLVELGKDDPKIFTPFLSDQRWYLVRNVVLVLTLLGSPVALEMIFGLISHKEARIRREVLGFLERSPDSRARSYILKFLRDESSALRIKALQILARERHLSAFKPVLALTAAEDFKGKELAERKAVYEALGELGREQSIPVFRELLLRKTSWFKKSADRESVLCAVAGLMKTRSPAALELLEEARGQQTGEGRVIVEQALIALSGFRAEAAALQGEV